MAVNGKPVVMLVDGEEMVLTSIRAMLLLEDGYRVRCFTNPAEAARSVEGDPVDVIVSDYLMPGLTGIQLLALAKALQPEASACSSPDTPIRPALSRPLTK